MCPYHFPVVNAVGARARVPGVSRRLVDVGRGGGCLRQRLFGQRAKICHGRERRRRPGGETAIDRFAIYQCGAHVVPERGFLIRPKYVQPLYVFCTSKAGRRYFQGRRGGGEGREIYRV